jgi:hypothetical protein
LSTETAENLGKRGSGYITFRVRLESIMSRIHAKALLLGQFARSDNLRPAVSSPGHARVHSVHSVHSVHRLASTTVFHICGRCRPIWYSHDQTDVAVLPQTCIWQLAGSNLCSATNCCGRYVRFEVFTAVNMKNGVFWDVTPYGSCKNRCFGGI